MPDSGDWDNAVRSLAANNARLCDIALAADKLAKAVERYKGAPRGPAAFGAPYPGPAYDEMIAALEAFLVVRNGH